MATLDGMDKMMVVGTSRRSLHRPYEDDFTNFHTQVENLGKQPLRKLEIVRSWKYNIVRGDPSLLRSIEEGMQTFPSDQWASQLSDVSSQAQSPFFKLPAEIRNVIYELYKGGCARHLSSHKFDAETHYRSDAPGLLLACKRVARELRVIIFRDVHLDCSNIFKSSTLLNGICCIGKPNPRLLQKLYVTWCGTGAYNDNLWSGWGGAGWGTWAPEKIFARARAVRYVSLEVGQQVFGLWVPNCEEQCLVSPSGMTDRLVELFQSLPALELMEIYGDCHPQIVALLQQSLTAKVVLCGEC